MLTRIASTTSAPYRTTRSDPKDRSHLPPRDGLTPNSIEGPRCNAVHLRRERQQFRSLGSGHGTSRGAPPNRREDRPPSRITAPPCVRDRAGIADRRLSTGKADQFRSLALTDRHWA